MFEGTYNVVTHQRNLTLDSFRLFFRICIFYNILLSKYAVIMKPFVLSFIVYLGTALSIPKSIGRPKTEGNRFFEPVEEAFG